MKKIFKDFLISFKKLFQNLSGLVQGAAYLLVFSAINRREKNGTREASLDNQEIQIIEVEIIKVSICTFDGQCL